MPPFKKEWILVFQLVLGTVILLAIFSSVAHADIKAFRIGEWPDRTRLVLETDRQLTYELTFNEANDQIVITLPGVQQNILAETMAEQIPSNHLLIRNVDFQADSQMKLRLSDPVTVNIFNLKPEKDFGHRLVIDLYANKNKNSSPLLDRKPAKPAKAAKALPESNNQTLSAAKPEKSAQELPPNKQIDELKELWLEVSINNQTQRNTVFALRRSDGEIMLSERDLHEWRMNPPSEGYIDYQGERFFLLSDLDIQAELDLQSLTLTLQAPADLFDSASFNTWGLNQLSLTPSSPGAFFNYDISSTHFDFDNETRTSGLFELGTFSTWGSGTTNFLARHNQLGDLPDLVRLDTTWRKDYPEKMHSLVLGDTFIQGTSWSGSVRFGGVQWGTNFSTQPEFVRFPLMSFSGEAALPSTLDLYVNDALRLRQDIPPGPFTIDEIPTITGDGQARLVVRDLLGREKVITQDFYASQRMLRPGLNEYSLELGAIRENYGLENNDYGRVVAAGTWRRGISDNLTLETHGQLLRNQGMAGMGTYSLLPFGALFTSALAISQTDSQRGELLKLGLQRQGQILSFGIDSQLTSEDFVRVGMSENFALPSQQSRIFANLSTYEMGSINVAYTRQDYRQHNDVEFVNLGYTMKLKGIGYLQLTALHFVNEHDTTLRLSLTLPMSMKRTTSSISASQTDTRNEGTLQVQRSLPVGIGFGYRLRAGVGDSDQRQASLSYQNDYGLYQLEGSRLNGQSATRANIRGGAAIVDRSLFASRYLDNSFAIVKVPGFEGVRIYAENQQVARTNSKGEALIPRLRAYERNKISIEQLDIPLDANISGLNMEISPYYRSGVTLTFPVIRTRNAFFSLVLKNGEYLPIGAFVTNEQGEHFPVGNRGEVFLEYLEKVNHLQAHWQERSCQFTLVVPDSDEPIRELGEVACSEITAEH